MFSSNPIYISDIKEICNLDLPWLRLKNSSVLVIGATGMIGTVLTDVFMYLNAHRQLNINVSAMGRTLKKLELRFHDYLAEKNFSVIVHDINKPFTIQKHFDYVFHCASNTHPKAYATDPIGTIMTNVLGTQHVLQFATEHQTHRVLFFSSVEIYGENTGFVEQFTETDYGYIDCNTLRAGYPEGKRTGEALCQAYIQQYNIDVVIPRICRVFGPTMQESDSKALAQFIKKAVAGENIVLKSNGKQYFSYSYVGDVVSALLYLLFYGKKGEAYNIADDSFNIRLKDLAQMLANIGETKVVFELPDAIEAKGFSKATTALLDSSKLKRLGWKTSENLETRLKNTISVLKML